MGPHTREQNHRLVAPAVRQVMDPSHSEVGVDQYLWYWLPLLLGEAVPRMVATAASQVRESSDSMAVEQYL
jgi:hypothetical protein